jgi:hypothetical protein
MPSERVIVCVPVLTTVAVTSVGGTGAGVVTATVLVASTGTVVVLPSGHVMTCVPVVCIVALMTYYILAICLLIPSIIAALAITAPGSQSIVPDR